MGNPARNTKVKYSVSININLNPPYENNAMIPIRGGITYNRMVEIEAETLTEIAEHFDSIERAIANEFPDKTEAGT